MIDIMIDFLKFNIIGCAELEVFIFITYPFPTRQDACLRLGVFIFGSWFQEAWIKRATDWS